MSMCVVLNMGQALSRSESRAVAFRLIFAGGDWHVALPLALGDKFAPAPEQQYLARVLDGYHEHAAAIDEKIATHLQATWTIDRLRQTDLAVLRLALTEIILGDVPVPVIIKEAVILAKQYGESNSGAFVNGILAKITE